MIVSDRTKQTLFNIIFDKVLPETQINTDCFSSYKILFTLLDSDEKNFYNYYDVNNFDNFVDQITDMHINNIEKFLINVCI